jgi:hypothetical protein
MQKKYLSLCGPSACISSVDSAIKSRPTHKLATVRQPDLSIAHYVLEFKGETVKVLSTLLQLTDFI